MVPGQPRPSQQPPLPLPKLSHKYTQCELGPQRQEVMACPPHPHHIPTDPHRSPRPMKGTALLSRLFSPNLQSQDGRTF